jgi:hypothetical protein
VEQSGFAYTVALLWTEVAVGIFLVDGIMLERRLEVVFFIAASLLLCAYVIYGYFQNDSLPSSSRRLRLILVLAAQPINLGGGIWTSMNMEWLAFHVVGGDPVLQGLYHTANNFNSLLRLDFSLAVTLLLLTSLSGLLSDDQEALAITGICISVAWLILGHLLVRKEQTWMIAVFAVFAVFEPAFILYKFVEFSSGRWGEATSFYPIFLLGSIAILVRGVALVLLVQVVRGFGQGLPEALAPMSSSSATSASRAPLDSSTPLQAPGTTNYNTLWDDEDA